LESIIFKNSRQGTNPAMKVLLLFRSSTLGIEQSKNLPNMVAWPFCRHAIAIEFPMRGTVLSAMQEAPGSDLLLT